MEVKEVIEFLGEEIRWKTNDGIKEPKGDTLKMCEVLTLLKSLESENKKLKQENKAYKGMWGWLSIKWGCSTLDNNTPTDFTLDDEMNLIEEQYLGGGK